MHALKVCAATAAALIALAAVNAAPAQFFDTPPPVKKTKKAKTPKAPPVAPVAPAAPDATQPDAAPPQATAPAQTPPAAAPAAFTGVGTHPAKRPLPPPPHEGCRNTGNFATWLDAFKRKAAGQGISQQTIASALSGQTLNQSVMARDRQQSFFAQTFLDFQAKLATPNRVQSGRRKIAENKATFDRVQKDFGVPASVITGFWALESDFGAGMGKFPIMPALVTLAYDCRRTEMFNDELMAALQIIDRGDMSPSEMIGSWAGEIGQTQFLPTRYLDYAIDYDGDGRPNLFRNDVDVIGSTANYMHNLGWRPNEPWLEEVRLTADLPWEQADLLIKLPLEQWSAWGVRRADGSPLPKSNLTASLLLPMGRNGPAFLAYPNFDVYTQWNQSLNYATTAAYLATRIDGAQPMGRGRGPIVGLDRAQTQELQGLLAKRGYDVGKIDGLAGQKTRTAVKDMQKKLGLPADSYPTPELLAALRGGG
jgi:lytic murein transglycosylase